jgi:glycosyltransferase involved in cell wall biosynthesis
MPMQSQVVLLVSPQPWTHIPISKHNYAIALALRGCRVIFTNPPVADMPVNSTLDEANDHLGLQILTYRQAWFAKLRFHLPSVFDWLMARHVRRVLQTHHILPDVVWCFDFNLFGDLRVFHGATTIFHPVDPLSDSRHIQAAATADLVLTVSAKIACQLNPTGRPVHVVNHGLATSFEKLAHSRLAECDAGLGQSLASNRRLKVGYAGNLGRRPVNRRVLREIIEQNPEVDFLFWGPADAETEEVTEFVAFLRRQAHVTLFGPVSQAELAAAYSQVDLFLLSYAADPRESDRSNSHKILEYLSTGRVVVSSRIQAYEHTHDLLVMSHSDTDADLPQRFTETLARLTTLNSVQLQRERIALALDNTYDRQIDRIFALLRAANS